MDSSDESETEMEVDSFYTSGVKGKHDLMRKAEVSHRFERILSPFYIRPKEYITQQTLALQSAKVLLRLFLEGNRNPLSKITFSKVLLNLS